MKTIRDEKCRDQLIARLNNLKPDAKASWGKMNVEQMLSHLVQAGELPFVTSTGDHSNIFSRTLLKPLVLYVLPIPKEVKTSPDMDQQQEGRKPLGFEIDKAHFVESIHRLATLGENHDCLDHPFFGKMSAKDWGVLAHKHTD